MFQLFYLILSISICAATILTNKSVDLTSTIVDRIDISGNTTEKSLIMKTNGNESNGENTNFNNSSEFSSYATTSGYIVELMDLSNTTDITRRNGTEVDDVTKCEHLNVTSETTISYENIFIIDDFNDSVIENLILNSSSEITNLANLTSAAAVSELFNNKSENASSNDCSFKNSNNITDFPYIAFVNTKAWICGGAIVSNYFVITNAHCLNGLNASTVFVRVGTTDVTDLETGTDYQAEKIFIHPDYNSETEDYSYGLVRVNNSIKFSSSVQSIPLATADIMEGSYAILAGAGEINSITNAEMYVMDYDKCNETFNYWINQRMFCTETYTVCPYYPGFPLTKDDRLIGIMAWFNKCASQAYMKIFSCGVTDWIFQTLLGC